MNLAGFIYHPHRPSQFQHWANDSVESIYIE